VAKDGTLTTKENQEATGTLSATDPDGDSLTFRIVTQPQHGKVSLDNPNTGAYTYTPAHNYSGADSFVFVANDGTADSNKATVKVTVKKNSGGGGGGAFGGLGLGLLAGLGGLIFLIRRKR
jgi:VCBS repeat-containing protein